MKKILSILLLLFSSSVVAEDISDFQIEGMKIGDSLLDYMSEDEIKSEIKINRYMYELLTEEFGEVYLYKGLETYEMMSFFVRLKDRKYIIHSIDGLIMFENNIKGCIKKKNEIVGEMSEVFKSLNKVVEDNWPMASGHGELHFVRFKFESDDFAEVTCYEYNDSWNAPNHLRIGITRIEVENWIIDKAF